MTMTEEAEARPPQESQDEVLTLTLRARPGVSWDEAVVDNEGLGRKSSKRCCIFHKQRPFGESSTDSSDYESEHGEDDDEDDGDKKPRATRKKGKKIAGPKKDGQVPDFQRFHA
jgi:protein phosphatase 1 regulatory subunit 11